MWKMCPLTQPGTRAPAAPLGPLQSPNGAGMSTKEQQPLPKSVSVPKRWWGFVCPSRFSSLCLSSWLRQHGKGEKEEGKVNQAPEFQHFVKELSSPVLSSHILVSTKSWKQKPQHRGVLDPNWVPQSAGCCRGRRHRALLPPRAKPSPKTCLLGLREERQWRLQGEDV